MVAGWRPPRARGQVVAGRRHKRDLPHDRALGHEHRSSGAERDDGVTKSRCNDTDTANNSKQQARAFLGREDFFTGVNECAEWCGQFTYSNFWVNGFVTYHGTSEDFPAGTNECTEFYWGFTSSDFRANGGVNYTGFAYHSTSKGFFTGNKECAVFH
jgi:hypothetical protein